MPAKKMKRVKHNSTAPREKSEILKSYCSAEEFDMIKDYAHRGAVFVLLGSEYTDTREFYKGLHQIMYSPVCNGACIYDSHFQYREASNRPYVTISLNDPVNVNHKIDNMKLLDRYRSTTLYTVDYEEEERKETEVRKSVAINLLHMLGYKYIQREGEPVASTRVKSLDKLCTLYKDDKAQFLENLVLNYLLSGTPLTHKKLFIYEGIMCPIYVHELFSENAGENITVSGKEFSFDLYKNNSIDGLDDAILELAVRVDGSREFWKEYIDSLMQSGGYGYNCARYFLYKQTELLHAVDYNDIVERRGH